MIALQKEHYPEPEGSLPLLPCRLRLVAQQPGLTEHGGLVPGQGLPQFGPAAQASTAMALMGDEDQLGSRVHTGSLASHPSGVPPAARPVSLSLIKAPDPRVYRRVH